MSKARLFNAIKALDVEAVSALLDSHPELSKVKDERRRNALHFLCGLPASDKTRARSLALARLLLDRGFDVDEPAFVEGGGAFKATPLWYALSRGRNHPLAKLLLKRGSTPEYCLWTAGSHDDVEAIDLLVKAGARLDPVAEDETPFLGAIKWSRFKAAERLLHHGANVNFQNSKGVSALHALVKKRSERRYMELLLRHGADPRLRDAKGVSPLDMVARQRDKALFHLFSRLDTRPAAGS